MFLSDEHTKHAVRLGKPKLNKTNILADCDWGVIQGGTKSVHDLLGNLLKQVFPDPVRVLPYTKNKHCFIKICQANQSSHYFCGVKSNIHKLLLGCPL